jgi:chromosome segregation ATPase
MYPLDRVFRHLGLSLTSLLVLSLFMAPVLMSTANGQDVNGELEQLQQTAQEYSNKLQKIQNSVIEASPELQALVNELNQLQKKKAAEYTPKDANQQQMMQARMKLMQDKELVQKRNDVMQKVLAAMKEKDPKTQTYIDKLNEAAQRIQELKRQQAAESQGQGPTKGQE